MATPNYGYELPTVFGDDDAWGTKLNGNWSQIDTDLKTAQDTADSAVAGNIPVGGIVMWSGLLANIPSGWSLCDGTGGTPDLRDKFIVGATAGADPGETGGSDSVTLAEANLPAHTHDGGTLTAASAGDHTHAPGTLAAADAGSHDHQEGSHLKNTSDAGSTTVTDITGGQNQRAGSYSGSEVGRWRTDTAGLHGHTISGATATDGTHTHSITGATGSVGSGTAFDNRPSYFALAFIMRTT